MTILSIILGVAAGVMFYYPDMTHTLIGIFLLMWANHYDSCDGQLARMTGKKTRWGRMLDGFAGDLWFITIYVAICLRLMNQPLPFHLGEASGQTWSIYIWLIAWFSGTVCHSKQCTLADYYRNIHLFFLKGKAGSELDNFKQQREISIVCRGKATSGGRPSCILCQLYPQAGTDDSQLPAFLRLCAGTLR